MKPHVIDPNRFIVASGVEVMLIIIIQLQTLMFAKLNKMCSTLMVANIHYTMPVYFTVVCGWSDFRHIHTSSSCIDCIVAD